ncbi:MULTISPECIES: TIGR03013 family XrtA/PEP-CTERM system glycosyltransferase [unclassified Iodidimonas]|nr:MULTISPECIES: TIGR03013 family XrtA/PEP-CTERM system glycosyltransferase [unclassified Iodidimonas]
MALLECLIIYGCFLASVFIHDNNLFSNDIVRISVGIISICIIIGTVMFSVGLYNWKISTGYSDIAVRIISSFVIGYLAYVTFVYVISYIRLPPTVILFGMIFSLIGVLILRLIFVRLTKWSNLKSRVLVLGTGKQAARIVQLEQLGHASRFVTTGFVNLESVKPRVDQNRIIDMPDDLADYALKQDVDEVVVALEERRGQVPLAPLINTRLRGVSVTDYQTFCERVQGRIDLDALRPSWFFQSDGFRRSGFHRLIKRTVDIVLSLVLLIFTMPLLLLTMILIRLESPGGAFYVQERVGLGGKPFTLVKFRSMRNDAEKNGEAQWAQKGDARVTRIGALIRKSRIDEIPQVINVLKGDMSFVGPRPERPVFVDLLAAEIPFYQERHSVRPGITGWAQLNYPYGASAEDARQKLQYDLYYIKYFSIIFDLSIVLQTFRVVIWSDGAR